MSTNIITVTENKTFGSVDAGSLQCATASVVFTIPNDSTYTFMLGDEITVFNGAATTSSFTEEGSVSCHNKGVGNIMVKGYATFKKIAANEWLIWGDLL